MRIETLALVAFFLVIAGRPARACLISKGLIYAPEHGVVAFNVPGMAEFPIGIC